MDGIEHYARAKLLKLAESLLWTPYMWAGDDPSGFDCSGFVIELLKSIGCLGYSGDWTAEQLFAKFQYTTTPESGDLIFWMNNSGNIVHVEVVYSSTLKLSIGAAGGGSSTLDEEDAWEHNAYIRIRPYDGRGREIAGFLNPYKELW